MLQFIPFMQSKVFEDGQLGWEIDNMEIYASLKRNENKEWMLYSLNKITQEEIHHPINPTTGKVDPVTVDIKFPSTETK